jgi:hypothetical protein
MHQTTQYTFRSKRRPGDRLLPLLAELCGDLVVDFCTTVKRRPGLARVGVLYTWELA